MLALRTQQVLGYETGVADVVDPLAGSYYVEALTDEIEADAAALIDRIDELGGAVRAIEAGFPQREIDEAAYRYARGVDDGSVATVGVNRFLSDAGTDDEVLEIDPDLESDQVRLLAERRAARDNVGVAAALGAVTRTARGTDNLLYPIKDALILGATVGEITEALLPVFGRYGAS
ncbi:MAG: methylmalonyl-CoA mutase family protein, partial [Actinomycetota bacterium]